MAAKSMPAMKSVVGAMIRTMRGAGGTIGVLGALIAFAAFALAAPSQSPPAKSPPAASPPRSAQAQKPAPPTPAPGPRKGVFVKVTYDSQLSVNEHCPVRHGALNPGIRPVYVNRQPVGFC